MIKAIELQIGDFVLVDGTPRKVEAITKKKIGYHRKENEQRLYYARLRDAEPIPLDENLVLKLGFTKRDASDLMNDYYKLAAGKPTSLDVGVVRKVKNCSRQEAEEYINKNL